MARARCRAHRLVSRGNWREPGPTSRPVKTTWPRKWPTWTRIGHCVAASCSLQVAQMREKLIFIAQDQPQILATSHNARDRRTGHPRCESCRTSHMTTSCPDIPTDRRGGRRTAGTAIWMNFAGTVSTCAAAVGSPGRCRTIFS